MVLATRQPLTGGSLRTRTPFLTHHHSRGRTVPSTETSLFLEHFRLTDGKNVRLKGSTRRDTHQGRPPLIPVSRRRRTKERHGLSILHRSLVTTPFLEHGELPRLFYRCGLVTLTDSVSTSRPPLMTRPPSALRLK